MSENIKSINNDINIINSEISWKMKSLNNKFDFDETFYIAKNKNVRKTMKNK